MGNAGICPNCGGSGTVWTGKERKICYRCGGSGSLSSPLAKRK